MLKFILLGVIMLGLASVLTAAALAQEENFEKQDFLFLNDEAYTQNQFEVQVNTGFKFLKNKQKNQEFEGKFDEDADEIEREHETKGERIQTLAMPLELQVGIFDWWEMEVETEYAETIIRTTEFNSDNVKKRKESSSFGDLEYGNNFLLMTEAAGLMPTVAAGMALIFPTGGLKDDELHGKQIGYEWNLKASKTFKPSLLRGDLATHANLGFGITPHVQAINDGLEFSKPHDLREIHYGLSLVWRWPEIWSFFLELRHELEEEIELNSRVSRSELQLLPGFSVRRAWANKFQWEFGAGFPIGITPDATDWGFILKTKIEA